MSFRLTMCAWMTLALVGMGLASPSLLTRSASNQPAPDDLTISIAGNCPGPMIFSWEGAAPYRLAGLIFGEAEGKTTIPGWCSGTVLGVTHGIRLLVFFRTGPNGSGDRLGHAQFPACGGYLQMIVNEGNPCQTSNVIQIPE